MVDVILTKSIKNLGKIGEVVSVAGGYARNYLLPFDIAVYASKVNLAQLKERESLIEANLQEEKKHAEEKRAEIESIGTVVIYTVVGEEGKLFGSVTSKNVVKSLADRGLEIDRKSFSFKPIKQIGDYDIEIYLHPEVSCKLKVSILKRM